ncbi:hypothetical protein CDL15_Pgr006010 [Punica granatum]|uniref:Uncharacterized protein n=1 Tax=Punica granatum TaxID=22663 RepID=A0A218VU80_PUNGR|nr:hypothetical protein CDL15_Pgr006010 [Punica granatum]PKI75218.1 hypothetical protein CRG98_004369 [Punica granatum]
MGAVKLAVADGVMTFEWVFCVSTLGAATTIIASLFELNQDVLPWASLAITTALVFVLVTVFEVIGGPLGEASFNHTATTSFYANLWGPLDGNSLGRTEGKGRRNNGGGGGGR